MSLPTNRCFDTCLIAWPETVGTGTYFSDYRCPPAAIPPLKAAQFTGGETGTKQDLLWVFALNPDGKLTGPYWKNAQNHGLETPNLAGIVLRTSSSRKSVSLLLSPCGVSMCRIIFLPLIIFEQRVRLRQSTTKPLILDDLECVAHSVHLNLSLRDALLVKIFVQPALVQSLVTRCVWFNLKL